MAQKPNKFIQMSAGFLTGLVIVIVVLAVQFYLKKH